LNALDGDEFTVEAPGHHDVSGLDAPGDFGGLAEFDAAFGDHVPDETTVDTRCPAAG
jgi:hypothetical protein